MTGSLSKAKLQEWLEELLEFRSNEHQQLMEYNSFTSKDDEAYCKQTREIEDAAKSLGECNACCKPMTLDEAIAHASEVAERDGCGDECASQHSQLAKWLIELKDLKSKHLLLAADFDNYRKRTSREKAAVERKARECTLLRVLEVQDDLERLKSSIAPEDMHSKQSEGFLLICTKMQKVLEDLGCKQVDCKVGQPFDVHTNEAVAAVEGKDGASSGQVASVLQQGWMLDGQLLRPAKVTVVK